MAMPQAHARECQQGFSDCCPHHSVPVSSSCSAQVHATVFIKADNPTVHKTLLSAYLSATTVIAATPTTVSPISGNPWDDLSSPPITTNPLYQRFSTLRI